MCDVPCVKVLDPQDLDNDPGTETKAGVTARARGTVVAARGGLGVPGEVVRRGRREAAALCAHPVQPWPRALPTERPGPATHSIWTQLKARGTVQAVITAL